MQISDFVLGKSEKIVLSLRQLYSDSGYCPYRMSKFEEYDLYAGNKEFLVSDNVITFTDTNGKLMALKPDVTLSIIKNSPDSHNETKKVYYNENVYRVSKGSDSFKEIMQVGVECFGKVEKTELCEVIELAAKSILSISGNAVLCLSDLDIVSEILNLAKVSGENRAKLLKAVSEKNTHEMASVFDLCGTDKNIIKAAISVLTLKGSVDGVLPELEKLLCQLGITANNGFTDLLKTLESTPVSKKLRIDFSVVDDVNYYNGIVFKGFIEGVPTPVLSGGQYDNLMKKMQRKSRAVGFAVYTDFLDYTDGLKDEDDGFVNIALPKGRLGEKVYSMFDKAGFSCPEILEQNRKLIFENKEKKVRYFWVKPSDVAIYVERGAADIGIAGKDILLEYKPEIYELLDLNIGKCRMAVAAPDSFKEDPNATLRVATKFTNIAKEYYRSKGRDIDIIHLNGSIEIAPILGLSDVIVDIVETGTTLKENNLSVKEEIFPISARLIANKTAYKFKETGIDLITKGLKSGLEELK